MTTHRQDGADIADLAAAEIAAWTDKSRAASGVPPRVMNPVVLARILTLAFTRFRHLEHDDAPELPHPEASN